jgi:hypothetical protein
MKKKQAAVLAFSALAVGAEARNDAFAFLTRDRLHGKVSRLVS